jgi:hypothetical protein
MKACLSMRSPQKRVKKRYVPSPLVHKTHDQSDAFQEEEFYSPGSLELLEARRKLAEFSLPRYGFPHLSCISLVLTYILISSCNAYLSDDYHHPELKNASRNNE